MNASASDFVIRPKWHVIIPVILAVLVAFGSATVAVARLEARSAQEFTIKGCLAFALALGGIYIVGNIVADALTSFTDSYVQRRTVLGMRRFGWHELQAIRGRGNLVDFVFSTGKFRMNLLLFANSREMVGFVRARVPDSLIDPPY